jgi:hypothetical protein
VTVSLVVITDGRADCLARMWESLAEQVPYDWHSVLVVNDDPGSFPVVPSWVRPLTVIQHPRREGGAGAVRSAWRNIVRGDQPRYVFHVEDDWVFTRPVDIDKMVTVLEEHPQLAQVVLRKQLMGVEAEWSPPGGWEEAWFPHRDFVWHRRNWSLNPCLYPLCIPDTYPWPVGGHEHHFTADLLADGWRFAFYGNWDDAPHIDHIGHVRSEGWSW